MTTSTRRQLVSVRQACRRLLHAMAQLRPQDWHEMGWGTRAWLCAARGPLTTVERALTAITEPKP